MEMKQEPVDIFIEEHKLEIKEYFISNEIVIKNEFDSIKREKDDGNMGLQQTIINAKSEIVDDPDIKCSLAEINDIKQSRKGTPVKRNNINPLLLPGGHTAGKPFKCEICLKSYSEKGNLNRHMRYHEKPFKCDICLKTFIQKCRLNVHMHYHTGEKPFKCDICLKTLSEKGALNVHMCYHRGEQPFECDICLKSFTEKIGLPDFIMKKNGHVKQGRKKLAPQAKFFLGFQGQRP